MGGDFLNGLHENDIAFNNSPCKILFSEENLTRNGGKITYGYSSGKITRLYIDDPKYQLLRCNKQPISNEASKYARYSFKIDTLEEFEAENEADAILRYEVI